MKWKLLAAALVVVLAIVLLAGCGGNADKAKATPGKEQGSQAVPKITLNVATAGDTNMADLQKEAVAPGFKVKYPDVEVNVIGTGPGDAGSNAILTKLKAQKDAGRDKWDIDVAVVHQSVMESLIKEGLIDKYVSLTENGKYVVSFDSKNSLGTNVEGYVIPMFHSQTAIAYNPDLVPNPPATFDELVSWIKANPNKFGYNGVKGGMSGVAFVTGYIYWKTGKYDNYAVTGPYDKAREADWPAIIKELKSLPVTMTQGNNGTLDMLNRGEIAMGPVWVDMFILWKNEGRMDPKMRLKLIQPGLPGQPMYLVVPARAANKEMAIKYIDYLASPEIQAKVIVERNGWYPGIDANKVLPLVSQKAKDQLFKDIAPDELNKYGLTFPLAPYLKDIQTAYEEN
ncbi:Bacterial extracellular solute-binding protein [Neomoorella glycerini]|uniref:Bacterial extracellular solute-binding protein n=1 Tax=Neomoorella glycerini TaxID=55779 RepID=A0A6I5ZR42_9FIRM|nr:extracellular solute-binding protein [Moorella glycerini]QGP92330.1 Bacterial extracellular solute-binding protein [Moorella glycerini]